jgi:hypothetical protein
MYLYNNWDITFLTVFILTHHPANLHCGRKPEHPEKTHDFRQSVDRLFSHESVARIEPTNSEVKGACSDDCVTEAPYDHVGESCAWRTHVETHKLLQVCKQVVTNLFTNRGDKLCSHCLFLVVGTSRWQLVTSLMALSDVLQGCSAQSDTVMIKQESYKVDNTRL